MAAHLPLPRQRCRGGDSIDHAFAARVAARGGRDDAARRTGAPIAFDFADDTPYSDFRRLLEGAGLGAYGK